MTHRLSTVLALAIPVSQHQRFDRVGRDFRYWQPKRTWQDVRHESALRGKAEVRLGGRQVSFWRKAAIPNVGCVRCGRATRSQ